MKDEREILKQIIANVSRPIWRTSFSTSRFPVDDKYVIQFASTTWLLKDQSRKRMPLLRLSVTSSGHCCWFNLARKVICRLWSRNRISFIKPTGNVGKKRNYFRNVRNKGQSGRTITSSSNPLSVIDAFRVRLKFNTCQRTHVCRNHIFNSFLNVATISAIDNVRL